MNPIESRSASLDTLSVTIQALHVSGKQMTLAVFRQLPEGVETETSDLWGIVRYEVKNRQPLWLVFSDAGILKKRALEDLRKPHYADDPQEEWGESGLRDIAERINRIKANIRSSAPENEWQARANANSEKEIAELIQKYRGHRNEMILWRQEELARYQRDLQASQLTQLYIAV